MNNIEKAYEITDAKIAFVSLVDKAANKRTFLITKAENGEAEFTTNCKIVKADEKMHYVTGVVYEPMTEDAHGNYMTEEEITKAAYGFSKSGGKIDIQHNFKSLDTANVVESYIAKCDMEIEGQPVKKGSWLMTIELDEGTFDKVRKGELTGLSMGGVGRYSTVDKALPDDDTKGLITKIAEKLGIGKGSEQIAKAGRKMSGKRLSYLKDIQTKVGELIAEVDDDNKEDESMSNEEITKAVAEAVTKAMEPVTTALETISKSLNVVDAPKTDNSEPDDVTKAIGTAVEGAVAKAIEPMAATLEAIAKAKNLPSNLNDQQGSIKKEEQHYMAGMF